jgi:single-stranded-DNA-specific exonuclease
MEILEPFGKGNTKPLFGGKKLKIVRGYLLGANKNVIKLNLLSPRGHKIDGLIFNETEKFIETLIDKYGEEQLENMYKGIENDVLVDILYYPNVNEYQGNMSLQVIINNYRFD